MCGIATIFNYRKNKTVSRQALASMNETMEKRGPDGDGLWYNETNNVGLAHRRLSIIDLSETGAQPMHSCDGKLSVIFNGEIYNYQLLRADLEKEGVKFNSDSDTEVLLHLYRKCGKEMVHKLRGMFAFAIWDDSKQAMFLARDPYGIKPLYYADTGNSFAAASQVKALLKWGEANTSPEPAGHCGFFLMGSVPEPYTLFRGIRSLQAGYHLWVEKDKSVIETQYASLSDIFSTAQYHNGEYSKNDLREIIKDSVKHHLVADVEVGVFLSAGLDSTTLTALASEMQSSVRSVTLGFNEYKGTQNDESLLAEKVAKRYATRHHTQWVDDVDFANEYDKLMSAMDQPSIDGVNTYFVSKITAEAGLKVALSGIGGDELFGGYNSFNQIPKLINLIGKIPFSNTLGKGFRKVSAPVLKQFASAKYQGLFEYGGTYEGAYFLRRGLFMPWELTDILGQNMTRKGLEDLQILGRIKESHKEIKHPKAKVSALESSWYMKNQLLRDADWAGMAHSLEIRVPFVDWHLTTKIAPFFNCKGFGKKAMANTPVKPLPESILNRKKTGFRIPVEKWLTKNGEQASSDSRGWAFKVYNDYLQSNGMTFN